MAWTPNFLLGCFGWQPMRVPRANEKTSQAWLYVLKILIIIIVAVAAFKARTLYNVVTSHPELLASPPYHKHIELAHLLTYVGLMALFPWLFISAALAYIASGVWIFLLGLIDFGLALTIAIGVGMQAHYLPASENGCSPAKAEHWQVVGNNKSFFVLASELGFHKSPQNACNDFVLGWNIAVAVLFFQFLISYIGIFFDERELSLLNPFRPLLYTLLATFGPPLFFRDQILPRMRFGFRFVIKIFRRMRGLKNFDFNQPDPYAVRCEPTVSNHKLHQILTIEHVLLDLVSHLHYEDVINFSLASKAVRHALFPAQDITFRIPKLKDYCCDPQTKKGCLYCNKRICHSCKHEKFQAGLSGRRHVSTCMPYCPSCYYQNFARRQLNYKKPCKCRNADRELEWHDMCRTCAAKDPVEMQQSRHKRYVQEARDIAFGVNLLEGSKVQCGKCKTELSPGMRWWVCGKCMGECRDKIHPSYVGRRMIDPEKAEAGLEAERGTGASRWTTISRIWNHWL